MSPGRIAHTLFLTSLISLTACGGNSSQDQAQENTPPVATTENSPPVAAAETQQQEVTFDVDLSALLVNEIVPGTFEDQPSEANLLQGAMQVTNLVNGDISSFPWTVNVDENDLANVQSFQTLVLEPGSYAFELTVSDGNRTYSGSSIHTVNDGDTAIAPMTIRPVIGDTLIDAATVAELIDFRFNYSVADINGANLSNPSIGITINNNSEQIFLLNPSTGLTEHMLLNLLPGQYDISLRLLDNGIQVGKSVSFQETGVTVAQGIDVSMDIVPLHGEFALSLAVEGADATVNLQIPPEVVDEVGGSANLQTILSVTGDNYPLQEQALSLTPNATGYSANVVLPEVFYGELTFEMIFTDILGSEEVGYCVADVLLSDASSSVNCEITLRRRQVVSGNLLSAVGINVSGENGAAIPGALISIDDQQVAITNSASFSTAGYSKIFLASGTHTIRAQMGTAFGEVEFTSVPLSVNNIAITLDRHDTDGDGVEDSVDLCPNEPANTSSGCSSNLATGLALGGIGQVAVWRNSGQGGFSQTQQAQNNNLYHEVTVGDLNQDGLDDIAVLRFNGDILVGLAPFTNGPSLVNVGFKSGSRPRGIEAADFNNDDVLDLVVGGDIHSIFLGNGDGSFGAEANFAPLGPDNRSLSVGDFDQDGNLDVTFNSNTGNCLLAIHYGDGNGNFPADEAVAYPGLLGLYVKTGDVDADGDLDILTAGYGYGLRVFTNNGNRNFTVGEEQFLPEVFVMPEDFNGDGAVDLVFANDAQQELIFRLNDGSGNFDQETNLGGSQPNWARDGVAADINADGHKDIVIPQHNGTSLTFVPGKGDGTFEPLQVVGANMGGLIGIAAGNFE